MAETRYVEIYEDGRLKTSEPYQVSDAELELESDWQVIAALSAKADGEITLPEIARFAKALVRLGRGR
ncbi:MAG: hypothetical protein PHR56_06525 [Dehalococcoidales bacterium]|nr:hypothetical protein [Dehalococcoidales bacterium]